MPADSDLFARFDALSARLGGDAAAWEFVLEAADPEAEAWRTPEVLDLLGDLHEARVAGRRATGTYYTPPALVGWLLERTITAGTRSILDPACGSGHVLVACLRRLIDLGVPAAEAVGRLSGTDLDPVAVGITRLRLAAIAGAAPDVRVGDGLAAHPRAQFDAVVGNPPFGGQVRGSTVRVDVDGPAPYTDLSATFLHHALGLVGPGGVVALVQPLSVLAARDAAPVRRRVGELGAVTDFWASAEPVFEGTSVRTCVPVVRAGAQSGAVHTWQGPDLRPGPDVPAPGEQWARMAAPALGIPVTRLRTGDGTIGDEAEVTADFRDQYYGLIPFVQDGGAGVDVVPLITSGLIDPAENRWGAASTRFAKSRYERPVVDLAALRAEGALSAWAGRRLVPKLLVATQGRVLEAVADVDGAWLPSVPVITVAAPADRLWHLLAVLLAPPVVADAAARYLGTALSPGAIKLSAAQVAQLPLPADRTAWDAGADLARRAQTGPAAERARRLAETARVMCAAYGDDTALDWWLERAGLTTLR